jgi:hypothetical protein
MELSRRQLERLGEPFGVSCTRMEAGRRMIYGGGGGGGGNTTATTINYSPEEAARRSQVMDEAQRIYGASAPQMSGAGYPGATPVGMDWNTAQGQELMRQGAGTIANQINATQQAGANAQQALQQNAQLGNYQNAQMAQGVNYGLNGAMDVRNNPYLQQAMKAAINPVTDAWQGAGGALAQQRQAAQQAGQVGSSRAGIAEGITNRAYLQKVGDITAQMGNQAYETGQKTFGTTLSQIPAWQKAALENASAQSDFVKNQANALGQITTGAQAPGAMYSAVGAQNENLAREWADYQANQRMWQLNAPWVPLQNYASIVYGGSAPSTSVESSNTAARNPLGQVVGAGLAGASMYNMMSA